ncbi:EAL domain-containing protein (putative c-di-GMP-specific phosphodiesterase class I)/GGDEF domain-containing protein [Acidovorax soli]|uniref:EAL domain-containing protein (Putative c-di-GMP-specific phosphodiesterase class I)/GGDEF domain-containing protein n=1 Tax=Acidovorax soli TaxID=592050 RepID=A0A7X0PIY9_9BURK|nr:EAL domain-containing protein [Acidovorax soli]MBB6562599.1 EAL domain-containing protein (putative c-di-GMP-specific phosphodiesterase class I)/GGDEF domain-containing protein [Acidovorax soli]
MPSTPVPASSQLPFDYRRGLVGALLWMVVAQASQAYAFGSLDMSLIWPADGIAMGLVLAYGLRMLGFLGAAVALWHALHGIPMLQSLIGVAALAAAVALVWWLVQRDRRNEAGRNPVATAVRFHALTVLPGAAVLTALGSWQFLLAAGEQPGGILRVAGVMGMSEVFGILLFTRLTEMAAHALDGGWRAGPLLWARWQTFCLAGLVLVMAMAQWGSSVVGAGIGPSVRYVVFLLVAWAAYRGSPLFVHLATAISALTLLAFTPPLPAGHSPYLMVLDQAVLMVCLAALSFFASATMEHRRQMERSLHEAASNDGLTGFLNERGLLKSLQAAGTGPMHLIGMRLHNLEHVVDLIGLGSTREIEQDVSIYLRNQLGRGCLYARPRDGFFVVAVPVAAGDVHARLLQLRTALDGRRYVFSEHSVRIQAAFGLLPLDEGQALGDDVLAALMLLCEVDGDPAQGDRQAQGMEQAPGHLMRMRRAQLSRIEALKDALRLPAGSPEASGLWLACQPIRSAHGDHDGDLGVEVLLRWASGNGSPHLPGEFLPLAERYGLMPQVDRWVITQVFAALVAHGITRRDLGKVAINLSGSSVSDPRLLTHIDQCLATSGLDPAMFCFEVTETAGIVQRSRAVDLLASLRAMGARTSLDDFGTGLATFDYLKSLPLDFVKIDGSFVRDVMSSRVDQRVVLAICDVARTMGLATIAEFVETPAQRALLAAYGVDYVQGFGIAKPLPLPHYLQQLGRRDPRPAVQAAPTLAGRWQAGHGRLVAGVAPGE